MSEQIKVPRVEDIRKKKRKVKIVSREEYYDILVEALFRFARMLADTSYDVEVSFEDCCKEGRERDWYSLQLCENAFEKRTKRRKK
uniref:hypothetical protein n=1 Tax=Thermonema rossianum TaxID=55505 RepID=UPI0012F9F81A|nr:hypothetical protein [Thermonema rossianum]